MRKVFLIARREYRAMVATRAFVIGLALAPLLMVGGALLPRWLGSRVDLDDKKVIVLDPSGDLYRALAAAAEARNAEVIDPATGKQVEPRYVFELEPASAATDEFRLALSDRIRKREIHAFIEVPPGLLDAPAGQPGAEVAFHAENAPLSDVRRWLERTLNGVVQTRRLERADIDPQVVRRASTPVAVDARGLFERTASGEVKKAERADRTLAIFLPVGIMTLMFMVLMMASQPVLESVLEEKQLRIAEVLLGCASPFQLLAGKLLGCVAGSLTITGIYVVGGYVVAAVNGFIDRFPLEILPWFVVYQVLAVLLLGSLYLAVGAAVATIKEAQGLLMPVWLLLIVPWLTWFNVVREPMGSLATWLSFFPPATPMIMVLRLAATSAVPFWQPALGVVLVLLTTLLGVFAAARIFRIGILAQGKSPGLGQLLRWVVSG
jgi:ABC-2 type transport system permease protein